MENHLIGQDEVGQEKERGVGHGEVLEKDVIVVETGRRRKAESEVEVKKGVKVERVKRRKTQVTVTAICSCTWSN